MIRLLGFFKVTAVLAVDYLCVYALCQNHAAAMTVTGLILLWSLFGGYIALVKEGAVHSRNLPSYERTRLETAAEHLKEEVAAATGVKLRGLGIYLVPDDDLQATAYGANCVSVTRGTLEQADPMTLKAVLLHEVSHILNCDPEYNRAVFGSIFALCCLLSITSFAVLVMVFLIFLVLSCFRSWVGVMAFNGTTKLVGGLFSLMQKGVVAVYQLTNSLQSRMAEYRCDGFSARLGYGAQLAHFLSFAAMESGPQLTLTEALYRSHPPTPKRIARLEAYADQETGLARR